MTNANFFGLKEASTLTGCNFFPDTNVWIFIYGNSFDPRFQDKSRDYSNLIATLEKTNTLFTTEKVIGEFYNRVCKIEAEIITGSKNFADFKAFRRTPDFQELATQVYDWCNEILESCTYINCNHTPETLRSSLQIANQGLIDLTDASIDLRCKEHNLILITDDGDFANCNLPIVTGNDKLIRELGRTRA